MKKTTKILIEEFKKIEEDKVILLNENDERFISIAIMWHGSVQFIVELSYSGTYGFKKETKYYHLQQIYPIRGYISGYRIQSLEDAIASANERIKESD